MKEKVRVLVVDDSALMRKLIPTHVVFNGKVGALTGVLGKLAKANINLVSLSAVTAGKRRYGMVFWVKKKDVARAARVLGAR